MYMKKISLILLLLVTYFTTFSQEGVPVYSDYLSDNLYLIHPSMAGASVSPKLRLTARKQWFNQENAPNVQTLTFNGPVGDHVGLGAILYHDKNGYHSQTGGYLSFAYHLLFSRSRADMSQLSFGLSAGLIQNRLDETEFDLTDFDPVIAGIIQSSSYFNVDVGASYNFLNFSSHFTVKNLIFQNRKLYDEGIEPNNQRNYLLSMAYAVQSRKTPWTFVPSFLFQWKERTGEQSIDINFKAYRSMDFGRLWAALSYRRSFDGAEYLDGSSIESQKLQYITPIIGANYNNFMLAYTYSYQTGSVTYGSGGFHQITLGYNILEGKIRTWHQDMRYNGTLTPAQN